MAPSNKPKSKSRKEASLGTYEPVDDTRAGSDSDDDEVLRKARNTAELKRHDNTVLLDEAENEGLLDPDQDGLGRKIVRAFRPQDPALDSEKSPKKRGPRGRPTTERRELMYELEEGLDSTTTLRLSTSSRNSSDEDLHRLKTTRAKASRRNRYWKLAAFYTLIAVLVGLVGFSVYKASSKTKKTIISSAIPPTTIVISLDGFRADFLNRGITPTLNSFIQGGVSPQYMLPSFPSVTFPNHYTLMTGLYPESHGIVGNTFWDPNLREEFHYTDPEKSMQAKWWTAEPLWVTAEKQGIVTAIHMWPGSEAHISGMNPSHVDKFNADEKLSAKVDRIMELLDLPGPNEPGAKSKGERPQLIAAYVPDVDTAGHTWGPNSTEIQQTIKNVDSMVAKVLQGLEERNMSQSVNVIVVSDHGMATTDKSRLIQLEHLIDPALIEHTDGWPLFGLRLKNKDEAHLHEVFNSLRGKAEHDPNFDVYLRSDMPARYHFSKNDRIAPLWIVPRAGWAIVTLDQFDVQKSLRTGDVYHPRGLHGYDFEDPLMRAIFVARGPAFPHTPGSRVEVFQNIEVYNIICDSIGAKPLPNNGTLRLPLKTVGLHSDANAPKLETPPDPVGSSSASLNSPPSPADSPAPPPPAPAPSPTAPSNDTTPAAAADTQEGHAGTTDSNAAAESNANGDVESEDDEDGGPTRVRVHVHVPSGSHSLLTWAKSHMHGISDWLRGLFHGSGHSTPSATIRIKRIWMVN